MFDIIACLNLQKCHLAIRKWLQKDKAAAAATPESEQVSAAVLLCCSGAAWTAALAVQALASAARAVWRMDAPVAEA